MEDWTISEEAVLPSGGKIYSQQVNPNVKLRSMTTEEEMRRLSHSNYVYKMFSSIIDDCLIEKPGISTYDMCVGDYQYLLYKLRIATYGPEYHISATCPYCGEVVDMTIDLDTLKVNSYSESLNKYLEFELPVSKKIIKLKMQTPRMLDEVEKKTRDRQKQSSNIDSEPAILFNIMSLIESVDGNVLDDVKLEMFVRKLPMKDTNKILQNSKALITAIGLDTLVYNTCSHCGKEFSLALPITGEFFGPTIL